VSLGASGRAVDGSVEGGEKMSSTAGVLGGSASRWISAVEIGSDSWREGSSGGMLRVIVRRPRPVLGFDDGFLSGLSATDGRCFFGDTTRSVLTGSAAPLAYHFHYS
jgi:hypothetical protein